MEIPRNYRVSWFVYNFSVRSLVVLSLVGGSIYLAVVDADFRPLLGDLAKIGIGGYLGQLVPRRND